MDESLDVESECRANTANIFLVELLENSRLSGVVQATVDRSQGIKSRKS